MNYDALRVGHFDVVGDIAFSPDGQRLATAGQDRYVKIWDTATWSLVCSIDHGDQFGGTVAWLNDAHIAICACWRDYVAVYDARTGQLSRRVLFPADWVCPMSDDRLLLLTSGGLRIISLLSGRLLRSGGFPADYAPSDSNRTYCTSSDGQVLCVRDGEFSYAMWLDEGRHVRMQQPLWSPMAILPQRGLVAAMSGEPGIDACGYPSRAIITQRLQDGSVAGELTCESPTPGGWCEVTTLAASPSEDLLAAGMSRGGVALWRLGDDGPPVWLGEPDGRDHVTCISFAPDGKTLVVGGSRPHLQRWQIGAATTEGRPIGASLSPLKCVVALGDSTTVVAASEDGTLAAWNLPTRSLKTVRRFDPESIVATAVSADARWIATTGRTGVVRCVAADLSCVRWETQLADTLLCSPVFSTDGCTVAVCTQGPGSWRLWLLDGESGCIRRVEEHVATLYGAAYSPDGRTMVHAFPGRLRLWDMATEQYYRILPCAALPHPLAFSPDGRFLAVGDESGRISMLDWPDGRCVAHIPLTMDGVAGIAVTRDSRRVIGASPYDSAITVSAWGGDPMKLVGHRAGIRDLAATPDGECLVSVSEDGSLKAWDIPTGKLRATMLLLPSADAEPGAPVEWVSFTPTGETRGSPGSAAFIAPE